MSDNDAAFPIPQIASGVASINLMLESFYSVSAPIQTIH